MSGKTSGIAVYINNLLDNLFKLDKENKYYLYTNSWEDISDNLPPCPGDNIKFVHTRIPNRVLNFFIRFFGSPKLDKLIGKKIDLFFVPDLRPTALSKNVKKVGTFHDLSFYHFPQYFSKKSRLWYRIVNAKKEAITCDKIIAVSEFTKKDLIKTFKIDPEKIEVIYEGAAEYFKSEKDKEKLELSRRIYNLPKKFFLSLSALEPRKNINRLIEAYQLFKKKNGNDVKLVLAGSADPTIFKKIKIPEDPDIYLTGFVDEKDKAALYSLATAFIYPSLFEGFGLPVLEAMSCGTPTITSKTSSLPEVAGDAALLIDPKNVREIANAMKKILSPKIQKTLKGKMEIQVKKFSWKKCAKETLKVFQSIT